MRKKNKNWEGSFTLPLLTDRTGYATASASSTIRNTNHNLQNFIQFYHLLKVIVTNHAGL